MEASSGRSRLRPVVVDFLATLFVTFCIGVGTALVLAACVVLMAGEVYGAQVPALAPMRVSDAGQGSLLSRESPLEDAMREGAADEETRAMIVELALTHHLVTKYASLVAIDRAPARPAGADLKMTALPANLPCGGSYDAVFGPRETDLALVGRLPQGATDSRFNLLAGALTLLLAALVFLQSRRPRGGRTAATA